MHQIYRCQYLNHSDQEIIGICLNPSCKQTRQYCYKCLMDNQLHQNCRNNFQKINQIEEVIQTKLNYLEYLQYQLSQKLKVLEKAWLNWMTELQQEQAKIVKILESLKNHNFFLLKQNLPSVIQFFLSLQNDNNHNKFQKGLRLAKSCDLLNAIKIFDEILKNDEKYPDCYYQKGLALMKIDKKRQDYLQKSVECFRKAIEMNKFHFDAYKNQGICLFQLEQYDQALKCFTSAITYGIYDKECLLYKAKILQKKDENFEACNILDKIINQDSQDLEPYFYKGLSLYHLKEYDKAQRCFDKAISLDPNYVQAYLLQGYLLLELEKLDDARDYFDKVIEIDPQNLDAYQGKIQTFRNFQNKINTINEAIDAGIKSSKLLLIKGMILLPLGDLLQNERNYEKAIEQYNMLIDGQLSTYEQAVLYFKKGKYLTYQLLGFSLYKMKRFEEAKQYFIKAINIQSHKIEPLIYLGYSLQRMSQHQEAIKYFDEVINKGVQNEYIYYKKGKSLHLLGFQIQAISCFDQAIMKCEKFAKAHELKSNTLQMILYKIGISLKLLGKTTEGSKCLEIANKLSQESTTKITQGSLFSTTETYPMGSFLKRKY